MKKGWELKKIKDLNLSNFKGLSPKVKSEDGDITLIPSGAVFPEGIKLKATKKFLAGSLKLKEKFLSHGDLLFNCGGVGTLGRSMLYNSNSISSKVIADSFVLVIRCNGKDILNSYLFYFFQTVSVKNKIIENTRGTTGITSIRTDAILNLEIPLPSLSEQQRIVAILDEAFAAIAKAKANAEENLKNAKELFESYLQGMFENKGEGWKEKEFGDVITTLTDYHANGSYEILKKNVELKDNEDYAWMVRSTDFENDFENDFRYTDEKGYNFLSKSKIFGGEIIMSKIGNAGNVYLMPKVQRPCSLAMNLFLIRLDEKKAIPEYAFHYLKSKKGDIQIKSRLLGMATKTITKDNVRNIIIPFPTLQEQQNIVQKLDALSLETKKLEVNYKQKINDLDELKKSVLQKAFSGELKTEKIVV